jgi:hypothetical protein
MYVFSETDRRSLPVAGSLVDIGAWLFSLSDHEYRETSRAHLGGGTSRAADGRRTFFDAERFPGLLIVNHHREEVADRHHVRVRSRDSRAWLLGVVPLQLEGCWEMRVHARGEGGQLECRLDIALPRRGLGRLARAFGVPWVHRRHLREQTDGFVADIVAKAR